MSIVYTDELIDELISCPKIIVDAPKEVKDTRGGFMKKTFTFVSSNNENNFNGFVTQNSTFLENFSIGLAFNPKGEKGVIVLLRVNGRHGGTVPYPHHAVCHVHKATAERINAERKPEGHIELVTDYTTLEEAIQYYVDKIGLQPADKKKYFPRPLPLQTDLFGNL